MIEFTYQFKFLKNEEHTLIYRFGLDEETFSFISKEKESPQNASWADLDFNKCANCSFKKKENPQCPVAKNINNLVYFFKDLISHKKCIIVVKTEERSYVKEGKLQEGLYSIFGVIMATSGCPHMDFLRSLARFHLPFASVDETMLRTASLYLLRIYLEKESGLNNNDISLKGLAENYREVELVNDGILKRIGSARPKADADQNALVSLNSLAQIMRHEIDNSFSRLNELLGIGSNNS